MCKHEQIHVHVAHKLWHKVCLACDLREITH